MLAKIKILYKIYRVKGSRTNDLNILTIFGLNGGWISLSSNLTQSILLKNE